MVSASSELHHVVIEVSVIGLQTGVSDSSQVSS